MKIILHIGLDSGFLRVYIWFMLKLNSERIRREMKRKHLDIPTIAKKWGCTRQNVYDIIYYRRPISQVNRLAELLDIRPDKIIINE